MSRISGARKAAVPFNRSRKKSLGAFRVDRTRTIRLAHIRDVPIQFMSSTSASDPARRDGWTDKWMYVVRPTLSSIRGYVKDFASRVLAHTLLVGPTSLHLSFLFFSPFPRLSPRSFPRIYASFLSSTCDRIPLERGTMRLFTFWKHAFILEESFRADETSRIDEQCRGL